MSLLTELEALRDLAGYKYFAHNGAEGHPLFSFGEVGFVLESQAGDSVLLNRSIVWVSSFQSSFAFSAHGGEGDLALSGASAEPKVNLGSQPNASGAAETHLPGYASVLCPSLLPRFGVVVEF